MIQLYWDIGRLIVERQEHEGWGKGIVDRLAADVQKAFYALLLERRLGESKLSYTVLFESAITPWRLIASRNAARMPVR